MAASSESPPVVPRTRLSGRARMIVAGLLAILLILAGVVGYWFVTGTGPFARIEPSWWALAMTEVPALQARGLDGTNVTVCFVDTGIDLAHPDLRNANVVAWKDFVHGRDEPYDDEGHGTAMAGIIAADGRLKGVAPRANLIVSKAIDARAIGSDVQVAQSIDFCIDPNGDGNVSDGADVISVSVGGASVPGGDTARGAAVGRALEAGIVVVAAAGNDGENDDGDVDSPASVAGVIAVGAVDRRGVIAPFSSRGDNGPEPPIPPREDPNKKPELVAPGTEIAVALNGQRYGYTWGTSPAAALVSGIVALLLQAHGEYRKDASGQRLADLKVALMLGAALEHDDRYGYGIVKGLATLENL